MYIHTYVSGILMYIIKLYTYYIHITYNLRKCCSTSSRY